MLAFAYDVLYEYEKAKGNPKVLEHERLRELGWWLSLGSWCLGERIGL